MADYDPRRPLLLPNEVAVFDKLFEVELEFKIKQGYFETEKHSTARRHAIACIQKYSKCPDFDAFTPYLAMNYFDRFVSEHLLPNVITGDFLKNLNLFVICCLTIAWKMRSKSFSVTKFQNENQLGFASKDLMQMEIHILNTLEWRMRSLTPICFAIFFFSQLKPYASREQLKTRPVFIIIIRSQNNIAFTQFRPSIVAASAVLKHLSNVSPAQFDDFKNRMTSISVVQQDELTLCLEEMEKWYKIQFVDRGSGGGGGGGPPDKRLSAPIDIPGARSGASSSSAAGGGGRGRRPGKEPVEEEEEKEKVAKEEMEETEEEFLMNFPLEWTSDDIQKTAKALSSKATATATASASASATATSTTTAAATTTTTPTTTTIGGFDGITQSATDNQDGNGGGQQPQCCDGCDIL